MLDFPSRIASLFVFLHHYRSPRGNKPLVINTQIARLGCVRRFFGWLCHHSGHKEGRGWRGGID
ncbi:MAG: hypothetical protein RI957_1767 [Verrucomicrobiota bacterium]